jgi:hypothetical protein
MPYVKNKISYATKKHLSLPLPMSLPILVAESFQLLVILSTNKTYYHLGEEANLRGWVTP